MPDVVEILVTAKNMTAAGFGEAKAGASGMEASMNRLNKVAMLGAVAMVGFIGESIKMAGDFDSKMALLSTQAGVSKDKIAGLKTGVLDLAGQVGFSPDSLAESLYHVESNFESMGISSTKALDLTRIAAEGAAVGHAKLVDVTNALTAAVASGIPGVQDFSSAMGVLNATVGVGDMSMQDLASAFGSGMVATVKGFGLTINDVGAGLAVFGDNNIRGAAAGTQLRMSVQALANPVSSAGEALKRLGMTHQTLADDMQRGGLKLALEDLRDRMEKAGITADRQGEIITQAFGRKAGAGLNVLLDQMDRLESKYPALEAGAEGFGQAWKDTQATFSQQMKQLQASTDALMISLGEKLIPTVQKVVGFLMQHKQAVVDVSEAMAGLLTVITGFVAVTKVVKVFSDLNKAFSEAGAALQAYKTRVFEVMLANVQAGESTSLLSASFAALGTTAKVAMAATAIGLVATAMVTLYEVLKPAPPDIDKLTASLENLGSKGQVAGELAKTFGANMSDLGAAVDRVKGKIDQSVDSYDRFGRSIGKTSAFGLSTGQAKDQLNALDQSLANLVTGGHADLAAAAVKRLDDAMSAQGKSPVELNKQLSKYADALGGLATQNQITAASMGVFGKQALTTSEALKQQALTAEGLKDAIIDLNDANRLALDSTAGFEQAIADATGAVEKNGRSLHYTNGELDLTSQAARDNEKALTDLAKKTDDAAEAALKNGEGTQRAMEIYNRGREKLVQFAEQMGLTAGQADYLANSILSIPDRTITVTTDFVYHDAYANPRAGQSRDIGGNAHGGIIGGAAEGGARGGMTWVGEQGPELVRLPFGSTVYPAGQSRQMAQSAASGGAAKVQIEWVGGNAGDDFMRWLRDNIRIRGGNVQTVLGQ